ncbi:hypothetical protein Sp245p_20800 (plasmid) [Azospirillum baldaniorum]|uniref:Surface antigen domain-containing protein n=1 Tax=Azospirillum baldaniorum TaxID=1064539 RepID=A0A9P1NPD9_9PROT|nr:conserved exported protein of unknown function [Azospirillum baldaniorum]AWJ92216.1 hypothetical protein Sp245p_20800 [Azospirillum baldaniorum]TWA66945.1 hypothetical protein FBZ84_106290 [Azospirillum baldaniorum]TWA73114.1 hypothetical protein FBZ85_11885 [Azospirillum brasilense]CCD00712.1 conserved exported protein of unknown function [Azospirillum baldaniorum]
MSGRVGAVCGGMVFGLMLAAGLTALPGAAQARSSVFLSFGGPVYPDHPPPHRHFHGYPPVVYGAPVYGTPVYGPPVYVVPAPPPVVYVQPAPVPAPPPAVVFTEPTPAPIAATPTGPAYMARDGQLCREYQTTVMVGGLAQPGYGTACRQPDGSWRVIN